MWINDDELDGRPVAELASWGPWTRELLAIVDGVREVGESNDLDTIRRLRLAELGAKTRRLLTNIGCQPALPGIFGRAIDVLRSPVDADPIHISEAIERLRRLAMLIDESQNPRASKRPARVRNDLLIDQLSLPGFEPTTNEGATP